MNWKIISIESLNNLDLKNRLRSPARKELFIRKVDKENKKVQGYWAPFTTAADGYPGGFITGTSGEISFKDLLNLNWEVLTEDPIIAFVDEQEALLRKAAEKTK